MKPLRVHIVHVGSMSNKGTQALLKSDVQLIRDVVGREVEISVSTTDVSGVKKLIPSLTAVFPNIVDIPYEWADIRARRYGFSRISWKYKVFALSSLLLMPLQMLLSGLSAILVRLGVKALYRDDVLTRMMHSDVVISYSDENFKETASMLPLNAYWIVTWWSMLTSRLWDVLIAKFLKKPVVMFPNSVGPFRTWVGRVFAYLALNHCDVVLLREPVSLEIVDSLGIKVPRILTSDTALLMNTPKQSLPESLRPPLIGVSAGVYSHSLSEQEVNRYIESHAKALDKAVELYGSTVVFLPHYVSGFHLDDLAICKLISSQMQNRARVLSLSDVDAFQSVLGQLDLLISSKMHPAVLAAALGVPTVCIAYDHKQLGFFDSLGLSKCVLSVREVSADALVTTLSYVWREKDDIGMKLKKSVPIFQAHVRVSVRRALNPYLGGRA